MVDGAFVRVAREPPARVDSETICACGCFVNGCELVRGVCAIVCLKSARVVFGTDGKCACVRVC
eukprot:4098668-Pleurochrysis_carterae.AAC.1